MNRSLAASLLAACVLAASLVTAPAAAHDESLFDEIHAPFACGSEWVAPFGAHHSHPWNLDFNRTSLNYGENPQHDLGQPLFAQGDGTVVRTGSGGNSGPYVEIDYGDYLVVYRHLVDGSFGDGIEAGAEVTTGQYFAQIGDTGNATGFAHLHTEWFDSRDLDDEPSWRHTTQTEVTFDGNVVDYDEVIVSANCVGDALLAGDPNLVPTPPAPDDPLRIEAAALLAAEAPVTHLAGRLAALGVTTIDGTTEAADFVVGDHLVAVVDGTETPDDVVIVMAHHQGSTDCADDVAAPCAGAIRHAAPTAVALALVERLVAEPADRTIVVMLVADTDEAGTAALELVTTPSPDPALDPFLTAAVAAIHLGPMGDSATLRHRNDALLFGTATWTDPTVVPEVGGLTELMWHRFGQEPFPQPDWAALRTLMVPAIGITDLASQCRSGDDETVQAINPVKLARELDDTETLLRGIAAAATTPVEVVPDRATTILDDASTLAALIRESDLEPDETQLLLEGFIAEPPDPITPDDVDTVLGWMSILSQDRFVDEVCDASIAPAPFDDVSLTSFAVDDVALIYDLRVTTGTSATEYSPSDIVTREQMAAFLGRIWRLLNPDDAPTDDMPFTDVAESRAYDDVRLLFELGITTGTSPTLYSPADGVTREQMAAFLARIWRLVVPTFDESVVETHPFDDVDVESFAFDEISLIFHLGITTGTSPTTYAPDDIVTREQMAAFLARLLRRHAAELHGDDVDDTADPVDDGDPGDGDA